MKNIYLVILISIIFTTAEAQSDLSIFGYFQNSANIFTDNSLKRTTHSFGLNQLNLFFQKDFGYNLSSFVNFEATNSFSANNGIGNFKIEEAWLKYSFRDYLTVRTGLIIPAFNNLNEIKNRTPLLPYVFRPLAYESTIENIITLEDYVPQRAFLQIEGFIPIDLLSVDYAVYIGNSETQFIHGNQSANAYDTTIPGSDTTAHKLLGGRVGVKYNGIKLGVSFTDDNDFRYGSVAQKGSFISAKDTTPMIHNPMNPGTYLSLYQVFGDQPVSDLGSLGALKRNRIGIDFSITKYGFTLETEYIKVFTSPTAAQQVRLDQLVAGTTPILQQLGLKPMYNNKIEKTFYYGNLGYDINNDISVYTGYSYAQETFNTYFADGLQTITFGGVFKPIEQIALKAQYQTFKLKNTDLVKVDYQFIFLSASIFF